MRRLNGSGGIYISLHSNRFYIDNHSSVTGRVFLFSEYSFVESDEMKAATLVSTQITIKKRDGKEVTFSPSKISNAIIKAEKATEKGVTEGLAKGIAEKISKIIPYLNDVHVELIQDLVEQELMATDRKDVAKAYILYREKRNHIRQGRSFEVLKSIVNVEVNDITNENANMNAATPSGMMMKIATESSKAYSLNKLIKHEYTFLHRIGKMHIHDQDFWATKSLTCVQHPLEEILQNGFEVNHAASRPAKSIHAAMVIACISFQTAQNEMHGGQSIPAFDFYMAPYVRVTYEKELRKACEFSGHDYETLIKVDVGEYQKYALEGVTGDTRTIQFAINRTVDAVHQACEGFIHNMNSIHSRGGNQVVFSSINYGTDTSPEGRCLIRELLLSTERGVGNGATAVFPIQVLKVKSGVNSNPKDPNYDLFQLACRVTAKRFFPNFLNLDAPFNQHEKWQADDPKRYKFEPATMGCRTRVFENIHGKKTSIGRGNASFTSLNLVHLALETMVEIKSYQLASNLKWEIFFEKLETLMNSAAAQLKERYDFQKSAVAKQFPMLMKYLWSGGDKLSPNDRITEVIKQATLVIGFIGLAEALIALTGKHHGECEKAQQHGLSIIHFMHVKCQQYKREYNLNYGVLATPAESLCKRLPKLDRERFGTVRGVNDREYYTNSNHVPVWHKISAKKKLEIEAPYHMYTPAGHISYVELDGLATDNPKAIEKMVKLAMAKNIGYFSLNHNSTRCMDCGYEGAESNIEECPSCKSSNVDVIQRITGYLVGSVAKWNSGKQAELRDRVRHEK